MGQNTHFGVRCGFSSWSHHCVTLSRLYGLYSLKFPHQFMVSVRTKQEQLLWAKIKALFREEVAFE